MAHPLERELLAHAQALRALARDLVGESMADDLVQDAAVEALRAPPRNPERLGGWLATIVRRLAGKHRRGDLRRRRREAAAARPEPVPPDRTVDDRDAFARLSRAVLALPEPYQSTIFERYLRDRTPTEIAAARSEPVRTVKTRLQRGLALLREGLDRDGRDWRGAFAVAFGIDRLLPASAAALTGVALMGTGAKLLCGSAAVAALVAGTWLASPTKSSGPDRSATERHTPLAAATPVSTERAAPREAPQPGADAVAMRTPIAPPAPAEAMIRGICVDAAGTPLAGVNVTLQGRSEGEKRMDAWLRDHPPPTDLDLQTASGADGAFAFRFAPPPPFRFTLSAERVGLARAGLTWDEIASGSELDLGLITLEAGARVGGRVIDAAGNPIGRRQVGFVPLDRRVADRPGPGGSHWFENSGGWSSTRADGNFSPTPPLPLGRYRVEVGTQTPLRPKVVEIDGNRDPVEVEIVLPVASSADTIAGVVVDATGASLPEAVLSLFVRNGPGSWRTESAVTDGEGRFRLVRPAQGVDDQVALTITRSAFDRRRIEATAWGTHDLRVVLDHSLTIELVAVAADDGTPVEDYRVRVEPEPEARLPAEHRPPVTVAGHHPRGNVTLTGLDRGNHRIALVPAGDTFGTVAMLPLRVDDAGPRTVTVRVPRLARRLVQVRFADHRPAGGSTVRLLDPCGQPTDASFEPGALELPSGRRSLLLQEVRTDERGEATLRGPAGVVLLLELVGPMHQPLRLRDVSLAPAEPLEVIVQQGSVVRGELQPAGAMRGLRQLAGLPADGPLAAAQRQRLPTLRLRRSDPGTSERIPPESTAGAAIGDDGTFALQGVPDGTWEVVVEVWRESGTARFSSEEHVCNVDVVAGGETTVALDVSFLMPGEVEGLVLHNGKPLVDGRVMLWALNADRPGRKSQTRTTVATDAEGRFRSRYCVGEYRVAMQVPNALATGWGPDMLFASERVVVQAGSSVAQTFHVVTGTVRCRVLDADGQPMRGVRLVLVERDGAKRRALPPTDADGRTQTIAVVQPQVVALATGSIDDPQLQQLREVLPNAGDTLDVELRLPDSKR